MFIWLIDWLIDWLTDWLIDWLINLYCRRLFSIMSYFLFFFNILVGLFSGFLLIIFGIVLGVVFLARIDRSTLMQGFQRFDRGMLKSLKGKIKLYTVFRNYDNNFLFYLHLKYENN